jgi:hypothetical protein
MLCAPTTYTGQQPILATYLLPSGSVFSIQHLSVDNNLEELLEELLVETAGRWDLRELVERFKKSFQFMAGSHTSQAFIASIDERHVFEIEVHQAAAHPDLMQAITFTSGDYIVQISAGGWDKTSVACYAESIGCCLAYFSRFHEVRQIFIDCGSSAHLAIEPFIGIAGFSVWKGHLYRFDKQSGCNP